MCGCRAHLARGEGVGLLCGVGVGVVAGGDEAPLVGGEPGDGGDVGGNDDRAVLLVGAADAAVVGFEFAPAVSLVLRHAPLRSHRLPPLSRGWGQVDRVWMVWQRCLVFYG